MNATLALSLITIGVIVIIGMAILALTIVGIHREERRLSLSSNPRSPIDALARRVLGAHVSTVRAPDILTARHWALQARQWPSSPAMHEDAWGYAMQHPGRGGRDSESRYSRP